MPTFRHNWITNLPRWLDAPQVQALVGQADMKMLEIGSFEGRGTLWFLEHILTHPSSYIVCLDPFAPNDTFNDAEPYEQTFNENTMEYRAAGRIMKIKGLSRTCWDLLLNIFSRDKCDLIYIDGSHASADVLLDSAIAWQVSKVETIFVWDDYATAEEKLAVDSFLAVMGPYVQVLQTGYQLMAQRIK